MGNVLTVETGMFDHSLHQRVFSFSEENDGKFLGTGVNQNCRISYEDLITPQFISPENQRMDKECYQEEIDLNVSENVKPKKVISRPCFNTLKINCEVCDRTDKFSSIDSGVYKDKCKLGVFCDCIMF